MSELSLRGSLPELARSAGTSLVVRVIGVGLNFVVHVVLARMMSQAGYGTWGYAVTWSTTLAVVAAFGVPESAVRFIPDYSRSERWGKVRAFVSATFLAVLTLSIGLALVLAAIGYIAYRVTDEGIWLGVILGAGLLPPLSLLSSGQGVLRATKRIAQSQVSEQVIVPLFLMVGAAAVVIFGADLSASRMISIHIGAVSVAAVLVTFLMLRSLSPDVRTARPISVGSGEWFAVSAQLMFASLGSLVLSRGTLLLLGFLAAGQTVAAFLAASKLALLLNFGLAAVNSILAPLVAEHFHSGSKQHLQQLVSVSVRWTFGATAVGAIVMVLLGRQLLGLFGGEYVGAYPVLVILVAGQVVNVFAGSVGPLLKMTGHERYYLKVMTAVGVGTMILTPVGFWLGGIVGVALVSMIASACWNAILILGVRKRTGVVPFVTPGPLMFGELVEQFRSRALRRGARK